MARFVRCMEGHAFDSDITATCPTCGAEIWRGPPEPKPEPARRWPVMAGSALAVLIVACTGIWLSQRGFAPIRPPPATPARPARLAGAPLVPALATPASLWFALLPAPTTQAQPAALPVFSLAPPRSEPPRLAWLQSTLPPRPIPALAPPYGVTPELAPVPHEPQAREAFAPLPCGAPVPGAVSVPGCPDTAKPTPSGPLLPDEVNGPAEFGGNIDVLVVNNRDVRLFGVDSEDESQRAPAERFLRVITQGSGRVRCALVTHAAYECRAAATSVRVGAGLVANGFALADPAATDEYQQWQNDARAARRGLWRQGTAKR